MGTTVDPWFSDLANIERHKLKLYNGVYWQGNLIVVPDVAHRRPRILRELHDTMADGHFGPDKTGHLVSRTYWWPKWGEAVRTYCAQCQQCQANKPRTIKLNPSPRRILFPPFPWHTISMDFIPGLPTTARGKDAIMVVVYYFTKMAHFIATTTTPTAEQTAKLFFDRICCLHGLPLKIISDRDSNSPAPSRNS
jgi:hypothetical protein